ncbi:MAG: CotH kinase family protein [Spirochaetales bacterium]|nr:CotH kinase family protein [Spirochaetales bacterium]
MNFLLSKQNCHVKTILFIVALFLTTGIIIHAQSLGDVNTDGSINIIDALIISQEYVGLNPASFHAEYADVDASGAADIIDALLIAQFYVGLIDVFPGNINPTGEKPKASFTISNLTPGIYETVTFDASGSSDPDGTVVKYEWDFDDGTTATGRIVTHAFTEVDDYNVLLVVTDNSGIEDDKDNRVFIGRPDGWTEKTHHKSADPNYDLLFPEDKVNRIDITISPDNYRLMEDNLATLTMWGNEDPIYVPVTVEFNGYTWWHVGMRYKGQSSLFSPKNEGSHKLPFRFSMDKYEDDYPEINNQRLYGFQKMTFCSNWNDQSFLREKICAEIFRNGNVPAAMSGYCRIYINTGNGPVYWGLYTMVEDPSDQMLEAQFPDKDGNLYKPEDNGANWTQPFTQSAFVKKTNEDAADWSDVLAAHTALHASRSNAAAWRQGLDASFDTTAFLRWLAINTAVVNWDSYGTMAQNYYVYQNLEDNGRLVWITWDMNLSMMNSMMGRTLGLSLDEVGNSWPLIRYLMDDSVYKSVYHQEMRTAMNGCMNEATVIARMQHFHDLIRPYVVGVDGEISGYTFLRNGETGFNQAFTELTNFFRQRRSTVTQYLNSVPY